MVTSKNPYSGPGRHGDARPEEQLTGDNLSDRNPPEFAREKVQPATASDTSRRFRLFVERVKDYAIFMVDPQGHVVSWNEGAERIKGYKEEEILGEHISRFYTPEDVERGHPLRLLEAAERDGRVENEGWRVRKDGSRFWADVVITAIRDEEGNLEGFGKVTRDLTERKQAERILSELSGRLVEAQDRERKRVSIALHDSTSPSFVSLISKLYQIRKQTEGANSQMVDDSIALAESLSREIRTVSYLLHPPSLETDGLLPTLRSYLDGFTKGSGVTVEIEFPTQLERLPEAAAVALYRIVQESLTSVVHFSGSSRAKVSIATDEGILTLAIGGQGRGLSSEALQEVRKGVGDLGVAITGMGERMKRLGGRVEINSTTSGTFVTAILPLNERPEI